MPLDELIPIRRALHRIPELGFQEVETQQFLLKYIRSLPQDFLEVKEWRTGLLVKVTGAVPKKTIGYRTDIDGLPIKEETTYDFRSEHEGMMHACGHDFHMTIALGVLTHFANNRPDDNLLFIFQPAEEGPGGALPMLESDVFNEDRPDMIVALHIEPNLPVGTIGIKEGLLFANTSELFINLKGKGGHAAYPHQANDMVVAASHLVTQLQTIVSRNMDPLDSAVVTIGKIMGGTKQNIIAENARIEGTIRTLSPQAMDSVKKRVEALVNGIKAGFECEADIDYGANYYQVNNDAELTHEFCEYIAKIKPQYTVLQVDKAMTGEDFGYFLKEIPGFMFWLGVETPYGLHHSKIEPKEEAMEVATSILIDYLTHKTT
ncbi:N-acetyldiaminopimelate deacetylase [Pseudalkalibacillus salsuginis]|uniref:N-acetyldiaminopimelate deacetylase n=1 Tax=Pseudalkalibacillus salsuginis TaxID=2910972 RepID=UPI001F43D273|nr:N-acetyldiaminopimelate deacetylase [Pseudalkalibacillus salsuginis]MCF6409128.1 N-acetyldiaminopimelate deacetylase [Pseudalkalibacillus salsuginis]